MTQVTHPSAQQVREYLAQRIKERTPPPALDEIRRQLGWELVAAERASAQTPINRG